MSADRGGTRQDEILLQRMPSPYVCRHQTQQEYSATGETVLCWDHLHRDETLVGRFALMSMKRSVMKRRTEAGSHF